MRVMDDHELLQAYAARREEDAFKALSERYVRLVYSAAIRQTGSAAIAEDVTQAVFMTLAQKAGSISHKVILPGWLLRTTRYAAANANRLEQRRQHYEQEAMNSQLQMSETDAAWQRIAPLLDEAVDVLPAKDRDAVVLRFFDGMSLRAVAEQLGISEDGAQKRVSRALEKLRLFFERRGKTVSVSALAAAIGANAVQAAPAVAVSAASQTAQTITHATISTLARVRFQILAIRAGSVAVLLGLALLPILRVVKPPTPVAPAAPVLTAPEPSPRPVRPAVAATVTPAADMRQLSMRVLDSQSGTPVTNARLILVSSTGTPSRTTNIFATDAKGIGAVAYSPDPVSYWSHRVEIFRDGYVPKFVSWSESQQDRMDEIPPEYTAKVDPAVTIGGVVVDEQNAPIPGARVVFSVSGPTQSRSRERLTMMGNYHTEMTDADGRWTCSHVPARFGMISFQPRHPQFQEKAFISDSPEAPGYSKPNTIPEADFLAGRAVMRLERGLLIAGVVIDENGQPIAGAKVTQNYSPRDPERHMFTGPDGSFRFENGRPKELALTVQAPVYAPVVTSFVMSARADQLRIVLPAGRRLEGRIVDEAGKGIVGASIEAASPRADSTMLFDWRTKADDAGRFSWDDAPAVQEYAVSAGGYETEPRVKLAADGSEQTVRLRKKASTASVRVLGQLLDAETKKPLAGGTIQIWQTSKERDGRVSTFTTRPENAGPDGKFRLRTSSGTLSYILEAQAGGYWPMRLTNQVTADSEIWLDMQLHKGPVIAGTVFTPAGEPAAGSTLVVCGRSDWAQLNVPGKFQVGPHGAAGSTLADAQGKFRLPPRYGAEAVAIAHPEGFIELPFSQAVSNTRVVLQPWGRIEGIATLAGKPLATGSIRIGGRLNRSSHVSIGLGATTDAEGHFAFETVPPGQWRVQREINKHLEGKSPVRMLLFSHATTVDVKAGETAKVLIGGNGRAVAGKAVAPKHVDGEVWTQNSIALIQKDPPTEYRAMFAEDGSFRIDDVPPGDYTLKTDVSEPPSRADGNRLDFKPLAHIEKPVSILPDSDTDLGVLELRDH
jgi:RNA polymerase sigma factor (sigma-70 family)